MPVAKENAKALGCLCDSCPFVEHKCVLPTKPPKKVQYIIVGESPGLDEASEGKFFIGRSGRLLTRLLETTGLTRNDVYTTNAILCEPSKKTISLEALKACRARLYNELSYVQCNYILAFGAKALATLTGQQKILSHNGYIFQGKNWNRYGKKGDLLEAGADFSKYQILASIHPAFALRSPSYTHVILSNLQKMKLVANGQLQKRKWPEIIINQDSPEMLEALDKLSSATSVAIDVETSGINPLVDKLRCFCITTSQIAISVPWPIENQEVADRVLGILKNPAIGKTLLNMSFDLQVFHANGIQVENADCDLLVLDSYLYPDTRHSLAWIAARELWLPEWKDKISTEVKDKSSARWEKYPIEDLMVYNARDGIVTQTLREMLIPRLKQLQNGEVIFKDLMRCHQIGVKMTIRGNRIDFSKIDNLRKELHEKLSATQKTLSEYCLEASIPVGNIQSIPYITKVFQLFNIKFKKKTASGKFSLDKYVLVDIIGSENIPAARYAKALLEYRGYKKLLSTYINGLKTDMRGFLHPNWKPTLLTGRWSCTDPNIQNIPKAMRSLFKARDNCWLVSADFNALEVRILALLAKDKLFLEYFAEGIDPHLATAKLILKTNNVTKAQRNIVKGIVYGIIYGSSSQTAYTNITAKGLEVTLEQIEWVKAKLLQMHPELVHFHTKIYRQVFKNRWVEIPFTSRRKYFLDTIITREQINEAYNYPIQGLAAHLMNQAVIKISGLLDWGVETIFAQLHDELVLEGPDPERLKEILLTNLQTSATLDGVTMTFPVALHVAQNWGDIEK